jgi:hypothetical protein
MQQFNRDSSTRLYLLTGLVVAAAVCRLLPQPMANFAPIGAMTLFGGACFASRKAAFLVPFAAMLVSDLVLNMTTYSENEFAWGMSAVAYLPFALIVCLGFFLRNRTRSIPSLIAGSLGASLIFFVVSNFSWFVAYHSPWTLSELARCYGGAIPFFKGTLASDAFYTTLLFGTLAFVESKAPATKPQAVFSTPAVSADESQGVSVSVDNQ